MVGLLFTKLRRDVRRRVGQFTAIAVTVFLGTSLFGASYDAFQNLQASYRAMYDRLHFADLTVEGTAAADVAAEASGVAGVTAVTTRIQADLPLWIGEQQKLLGRVVSLPVDSRAAVNDVMVTDGRYLDATIPDGVLLEQHAAKHFKLGPGDSLRVLDGDGWRVVTVAGIAASPEYLWPARSRQDVLTPADQFAVIFAPEKLAAEVSGADGPNSAVFLVSDDDALESVRRIAEDAEASAVYTRAEQPSQSALNEDVSGFGELSLMFPMLFLGAAAFATYILLNRLVGAQRGIIGTLAANGMTRRAIVLHYLGFGIFAGLSGGLPGALAGLLAARAVTHFYTGAISVPVVVNPLHPETFVVSVLIGTLTGVIAALLPALAATRLDPAIAMRGTGSTATGRRSLAERLLPSLRRAPERAKLILRGLERNRARSLYTAFGVVMALTLILISVGMIDTMNNLLHRQFFEIQKQDAELHLVTGTPESVALVAVRSVEGVAVAEPVYALSATIAKGSDRYFTELVATPAETVLHDFRLDNGMTLRSPPASGLVAGAALKDKLGLKEGDIVSVDIGGGTVLTQRVAGFVVEPLGTRVYMSIPALLGATQSAGADVGEPDFVYVRLEDGVSESAVERELGQLAFVDAVVSSRGLLEFVRSFMGLFYAFVGMMVAFSALLAFALLFNTVSAAIEERIVELATLRAAGFGRWAIFRLVTYENALLAAVSVPVGLVVGYAAAAAFMSSFSSDLFSFQLQMSPLTPPLAVIAVVLVVAVSQLIATRRIGSLDVAAVVRERSL